MSCAVRPLAFPTSPTRSRDRGLPQSHLTLAQPPVRPATFRVDRNALPRLRRQLATMGLAKRSGLRFADWLWASAVHFVCPLQRVVTRRLTALASQLLHAGSNCREVVSSTRTHHCFLPRFLRRSLPAASPHRSQGDPSGAQRSARWHRGAGLRRARGRLQVDRMLAAVRERAARQSTSPLSCPCGGR
jgi:hypothetical protein